jgi:hypothetical protein
MKNEEFSSENRRAILKREGLMKIMNTPQQALPETVHHCETASQRARLGRLKLTGIAVLFLAALAGLD